MVYTTEQNLEEYGEKIPDDKTAEIQTALDRLSELLENADADQDTSEIESALETLNEKWAAASEEIYAAQQQAQQAQQTAEPNGSTSSSSSSSSSEDEPVRDADFEVVDEGDEK